MKRIGTETTRTTLEGGTTTAPVEATAGRLYTHLCGMARELAPVRTAVVYPIDAPSLEGAVQAARAGLIVPVLIGPVDEIVPATLLREHPAATFHLDAAAAAKL